MSDQPQLPRNAENVRALAKWAAEVSEQAREAVERMQPRIDAVFASMRNAMKPRG